MANKIVEILCRRDGITTEEAEELVQEAREEMEACEYNPSECEDIMMNNLGLELDYIFDLLY